MSESPSAASETPEAELVRLRAALRSEQDKVAALQADVQHLKVNQVEILASAEAQEEYITNMLLKKLEAITTERDALVQRVSVIQKEREALILQLEQEEEYLTNTLQKKLSTVLREKIELENQLEQEEEYIVNELQKKLSKLQAEKTALEARLAEEKESHETLRKTQTQLAKAQQQNSDLQKELLSVRSENFGLTQRISKEQQLLASITTEKANLEHELEVEDERAFNLERRQASSDEAPGRGGRHRTRSQSLPVTDPEAPVHLPPRFGGSINITAVSVPGSTNMTRSGSGGLHDSTGSSSSSGSSPATRSPAITATSPPTSPRGAPAAHHSPSSSLDVNIVPGAASPTTLSPSSSGVGLATSGGGRSRRLSFAQNASLMAQYPTTPRASSTAVVLKQGWIRSTHKSKLTDSSADDYETDPEPSTDLFFVLSDDSTLVAWMNEMRGDDSTGSLFCINLDTVVKRAQDLDSGEFILETKDSLYNLRPQSEDLKEWCELLEQLDPLASK